MPWHGIIVGVVNKFLTVLLNVGVWDKHSTPLGITAVCICLGSGMFYEQEMMRNALYLEVVYIFIWTNLSN